MSSLSVAADTIKKPEAPLPVEISADFSKMEADNLRYEKEHAEYLKALAEYEAVQKK